MVKVKRKLTALDVHCVVRELKSEIVGAYLDNIYQLSDELFIFKFRTKGHGTLNLLFEAGKRIHLTEYEYEKPKTPPPLCRFMRKLLRNKRVIDFDQHNFDRIIIIKFSNGYSLILELVREGNLIIVDQDGLIRAALRQKRMRDRNLIVGEKYEFPPMKGVDPLTTPLSDVVSSLKHSNRKVVVAIVNQMNLPGELAEELCLRVGIDKNEASSSLSEAKLKKLVEAFREIVDQISEGIIEPRVIVDSSGNPVSVIPVKFKLYEAFKSLTFESFNKALDDYFLKLSEYECKELEMEIRREIERKYEAVVKSQLEHLNELENMLKKYRSWADLIMKNLYSIQRVIDYANELLSLGVDWSRIADVLNDRFSNKLKLAIKEFIPQKRILLLTIEDMEIPVNVDLSAAANASKYYDEAKKCLRKIERIKQSVNEVRSKMENELRKRLDRELRHPRIVGKSVRRDWYESFLWFYSSNGFLVVGGRDASQNEALVRKWMKPSDIFIHADIHGGPAVIIKCEGKRVPEQTLFEAAQLAVSYSKAWFIGLEAASAYWVWGRQVSKSPPSGEYLVKGAFMIYGKRNYIYDIPLRIAVGVQRVNGEFKLIFGPPSAIKRIAEISVVLAPGYIDKSRIASKVKEKLLASASRDVKSYLESIRRDVIVSNLPKGSFRIVND